MATRLRSGADDVGTGRRLEAETLGFDRHIALPLRKAQHRALAESVDDLQHRGEGPERTLVDGIGVTSRLLTHTATEPFVRNSSITGKQTMPEGTMIFRHLVTMLSMDNGSS